MQVKGPDITDDSGRTLLLRGCNLGGSSKLPASPAAAAGQGPSSLKNSGEVSFIGRPFPLEEAEDRFEELRSWGFTFIRFVLTWESLEHQGPGIYDEAYLAYLRKLFIIGEKKGLSFYLDPHQDVWSRWTGGDGAPAWTLEKLGMDLEKLEETGAAVTCRGAPYKGPMLWPVNYSRYAAATLFTLFFAGNTYAPGLQIEGESIQDWLQERYIACFRHCYRRLKNCKAIAGWGAMNEPHPGFIGCRNLEGLGNYVVPLGPMPSPIQAMAAASGHAVRVHCYKPWLKKPLKTGSVTLNPQGASLFKEGFSCPWKQAGVWSDGEGKVAILKNDHFAWYKGRQVHFTEDFLKPFIIRFIEKMKEADKPCIFFIEGETRGPPSWSKTGGEGVVNAFHQYDGPALFLKSFRPWFTIDEDSGAFVLGRRKGAALYAGKLRAARDWTRDRMGNIPCMLGEFGVPFDMNKKRAFKTGDYRLQEEALSRYYNGIDENLLHSTIWNYTADNTNSEGDHWNGEDLSIVSGGQPRASGGWLRPYPMATAGTPLLVSWDRKRRLFRFKFRADPAIGALTEIYAAPEHFGAAAAISIRACGENASPEEAPRLRAEYKPGERRIYISNEGYEGEAEITVCPKGREGSA
ncbi:MAG: cellulase family glycosylhydrolase [Treponema sp.]|nr:cellulase family glycosylhydrolase [Treponema sp.]